MTERCIISITILFRFDLLIETFNYIIDDVFLLDRVVLASIVQEDGRAILHR